MRSRPITITVRFNEKEYKWLMDNVNKSCLRREPYIRALIAGEEIYPGPTEEWLALTRLLRGMGNNLNQLTRYFHMGGLKSQAMTDELTRCINEIMKMRKEVMEMAGDYRGYTQTYRK